MKENNVGKWILAAVLCGIVAVAWSSRHHERSQERQAYDEVLQRVQQHSEVAENGEAVDNSHADAIMALRGDFHDLRESRIRILGKRTKHEVATFWYRMAQVKKRCRIVDIHEEHRQRRIREERMREEERERRKRRRGGVRLAP